MINSSNTKQFILLHCNDTRPAPANDPRRIQFQKQLDDPNVSEQTKQYIRFTLPNLTCIARIWKPAVICKTLQKNHMNHEIDTYFRDWRKNATKKCTADLERERRDVHVPQFLNNEHVVATTSLFINSEFQKRFKDVATKAKQDAIVQLTTHLESLKTMSDTTMSDAITQAHLIFWLEAWMPNACIRSGWTVPTRYALLYHLKETQQWYIQEVGSTVALAQYSLPADEPQDSTRNPNINLDQSKKNINLDPSPKNINFDPTKNSHYLREKPTDLLSGEITDHSVLDAKYYPRLLTRLLTQVFDSILASETKYLVDVVPCQVNECDVCFEPITSKTGIFWSCCNHFGTCLTCSMKLDKCPICRKLVNDQNALGSKTHLITLYLFS